MGVSQFTCYKYPSATATLQKPAEVSLSMKKLREKNFTADMSQVWVIERCDLHIKSNNSSHHTDLNGEERLVVRRGQPFNITLHLKPGSDEFKLADSSFTFIVETGPLPSVESGTKVSFSLRDTTVDTEWSASAINDPSGNTVSVSISSSPDAPIGLYSLFLEQGWEKTSLGQFILLFNAWCPRDAVYMKSKSKREEYVLAQHGKIYRGTCKRIKGTPWHYGQFEPGILDICLKILDKNPKFVRDPDEDCSARRNPVYVTRVLSAMMNSEDDRGVLVGEWGEILDGVHPLHWISSGDILHLWAESGPVRYGQCWVFAAVACTVSRALGIPCRVVTNFRSAHDTDANLVIEVLFDTSGDRISFDSIWNYHVWVESWMTRPDLGPEYDGWQASDPTPQETSDGVFCCGPASVKAIREGELTKKYDAPFIFAEVNADVVNLLQLPGGEFVKLSGSINSVGQFISTKAVGTDERLDITHQYKYPEGSKEERQVYEKAQHHNKLQQQQEEESGLHVKIKLAEDMIVGSDFEVCAILTNNHKETRSCTFVFFARAISYNGKQGESCGFASNKVKVPSGEERQLSLNLQYESYGSVITPDRLIQLSAMAFDKTAINYNIAEKTIVLDEPDIDIELTEKAAVNQPVTAELSLRNPLPELLQDCSFTIGGFGLTGVKPVTVKIGAVGPEKEARASAEFIPTRAGSSVLLVSFDSDKLKNIKSFTNVDVEESKSMEI